MKEGGLNMPLPSLDGDNRNEKRDEKVTLPDFEMPPIPTEDDFQPLPVEDALYKEDDSKENAEIYEEVAKVKEEKELPKVDENEGLLDRTENDYNPDYKEDLKREEDEKDRFIDKKKKRLIPFGGDKSKKKSLVKSSDFDERKNKLAKTKIMQFFIISVILLLFLMGLKNTFLPAHVYTDEQIKQFAAEGAGQTGFPSERGEAFVESFMESYLTVDRTKAELLDVLGDFYGKERLNNNSADLLNMEWGYETKQNIIIAPKVYQVDLYTDYSAQYRVSAYVSNTNGEVATGTESAGRWLSFAVNVYHDTKNDSLAIVPGSPTIIPAYKISNQTAIPQRLPLGNGQVNKDIQPALTPTINGFVEAFAKSSLESHESVVQYIDDKSNIELISGFGGSVVLNGGPNEAIKKTVYDGDDGIYRVDVTVKWIDAAASQGDNRVSYEARYIMRVNSIGNGKYAVSSFVPYTYYK